MEELERLNALDHAIRLFGRAWADGDRSVLDALLSDSYTHIDVYGNFLRRDAWLDYAASRSGRDTAIDFEHLETKVFGDVAIVTGRNIITGTGVRGEDDHEPLFLRFTQVWLLSGEKWRRESMQSTPEQPGANLS